MEYLIGLDIGTSSTKAIAFDLLGNIISKCNIGYPILNPKPPFLSKILRSYLRQLLILLNM